MPRGEPDRRVPIGRSGREIEQQLGEFSKVLVAEAILTGQHADKVLPGQQSVDIQIERLRQLRPGGFANGLSRPASPQDARLLQKASMSLPILSISRRM